MRSAVEALCVILASVAAALLGSWGYFRRYSITRPPIGVFTVWDVTVMLVGIVLVPYLYLLLPRWLVAGLLMLGIISALYFVVEPVVRRAWMIWLITIALVLADSGALLAFADRGRLFYAINNVALILVVVGLTNLWAQSGMQARDVAIVAGALAVYDAIATWQLPLMIDLLDHLDGLPFMPLIAWPTEQWRWFGIGLGDILLAAVFPLVARKAFGARAGVAALVLGGSAIGVVLTLPLLGITYAAFPVMIVLGPLIVAQYSYWRQRGPERPMWQYMRDSGIRS